MAKPYLFALGGTLLAWALAVVAGLITGKALHRLFFSFRLFGLAPFFLLAPRIFEASQSALLATSLPAALWVAFSWDKGVRQMPFDAEKSLFRLWKAKPRHFFLHLYLPASLLLFAESLPLASVAAFVGTVAGEAVLPADKTFTLTSLVLTADDLTQSMAFLCLWLLGIVLFALALGVRKLARALLGASQAEF